ncbi:MAG: sulfite reductase [NADPH] flavoprotein alpha-component, partial [Solirubrobacteraceae bacterium]
MTLLTTNSPFTDEQADLLNRLIPILDPHQVLWLNGYLAGVAAGAFTASPAAARTSAPPAAPAAAGATAAESAGSTGAAAGPVPVTVLYAS